MLQGGSEAGGERSSGQQHRKRQRRASGPHGNGLQPVPNPGRSNGPAVCSGDGAVQGALDAAQRTRRRGPDGVPSLGGGLRIFRSALAADGPPLRENGNKPRAGRGAASGDGIGRGASRGGADGSVGTNDLELLRQRALAAHAVTKT
jgi:hypothetical protein